MNDSISDNSILTFSKLHRLQWEPAQEKHVILYPEGMVELNPTSAAILEFCNGEHSIADIVTALEKKFSASGIRDDVVDFLTVALENNWVQFQSGSVDE